MAAAARTFREAACFIGTTNADTYLADETGGRRFWPVRVGTVDIDELRRDIGLLWAEAVVAFKAGEAWHLPREIEMQARTQQADRRIADPWEQAVMTWATDKTAPVTIAEALTYAVGLELDRRDQGDENRVARIFKAHGWERVQLRVAGSRVWHYRRPPHVAEPTAEQVEVRADRDRVRHGRPAGVTTVTSRQHLVVTEKPAKCGCHHCHHCHQ